MYGDMAIDFNVAFVHARSKERIKVKPPKDIATSKHWKLKASVTGTRKNIPILAIIFSCQVGEQFRKLFFVKKIDIISLHDSHSKHGNFFKLRIRVEDCGCTLEMDPRCGLTL